ncbi:hypothetical protein LTR70_008635 [Exophiala xenobiotica]|uniref:glucan endo-1,3-beta-D-glucosidase n=1 Tax=Lithohypha guttulata TaxID=1690604 RepID=A0ABR0K1S5_9EURO|nr:hypothetical protein LTR24_008034 [Lithohypha guttulata]KAK5311713.1 hypothetical protein LTR70_008635 [Exophiala xenobiotica]
MGRSQGELYQRTSWVPPMWEAHVHEDNNSNTISYHIDHTTGSFKRFSNDSLLIDGHPVVPKAFVNIVDIAHITAGYELSANDHFFNKLPDSSSSLSTSVTSSVPYSSFPSGCPSEAFSSTNYTAMQPYFGLNVANTKPFNPDGGSPSFKTEDDWRTTLSLIKGTFPKTNAVRIYSTTDNGKFPLMDAIPAAKENNLRILVGVWSGGPTVTARFDQEIQALGQVVDQYGCDNFAAVSVGNEDLNYINVPGMDAKVMSGQKIATTDLLVDQIGQVRKMLRDKGCCNTPVTHTDTWNELTNKDNPSVNKVIQACDQAVIANIFPYWGNATVSKAWEMAAEQSTLTLEAVKQYGKDLWLGETGWARSQPNNENIHGANSQDAQTYFNIMGCQILRGNGSGFYYIDWDEDAPSQQKPSFGLLDFSGKPKDGMDLSCSNSKPDTYIRDEMPQFMGGKGISGQ